MVQTSLSYRSNTLIGLNKNVDCQAVKESSCLDSVYIRLVRFDPAGVY